jgi:hypothetical protein
MIDPDKIINSHGERSNMRQKLSYGKIKVFAHRLMNWQPIPIFKDKQTNIAIEKHFDKILDAQTKRVYNRRDNECSR